MQTACYKDPAILRKAIRSGGFNGPTSGQAPGKMHANLVIVPSAWADAFQAFCDANPKPCPLLAYSEPGVPHLPRLGDSIDLRSDLPGYRVWRDGALVGEVSDITDIWRDDLTAFALGCSFGFEAALVAAGIDLPHYRKNRNVAMYDTTIALNQRGPFGGNMVVSMRFIPESRVEETLRISGAFPQCHGAPVHVGDPAQIGVQDIAQPNYGDPPEGEGVPIFWACGVTPQAALRKAKLPFAISHEPGKMLVCDVPASFDSLLNAPQ